MSTKISNQGNRNLAIVWTVTKFKNFICGYHFEIRTTQCALCYLADIMHPTDRLSKWYSTLQKYDFTLIDKNGKSHQNTQCLSRRQFSAKTLPHKNNKEFLVYADNYPDTENNNLKSVNLESVMKNNMPSEAKTSEEMPEAGATKRNNSSDDKNNS